MCVCFFVCGNVCECVLGFGEGLCNPSHSLEHYRKFFTLRTIGEMLWSCSACVSEVQKSLFLKLMSVGFKLSEVVMLIKLLLLLLFFSSVNNNLFVFASSYAHIQNHKNIKTDHRVGEKICQYIHQPHIFPYLIHELVWFKMAT